MTLEEFKQKWVEAGFKLENLVLNYYKIVNNDDGYVTGFYAVPNEEGQVYDFYGQMALYPEATEGWVKFIADESECGGDFVVDEDKKAEIIAAREEAAKEAQKEADRPEAQLYYTALLTDTLLPEE